MHSSHKIIKRRYISKAMKTFHLLIFGSDLYIACPTYFCEFI